MNRLKWRQTRITNMVLNLLGRYHVQWRCVEVNHMPGESVKWDVFQVTIEVGLPMLPSQHIALMDMADRWHFKVRVWSAQDGPAVLEA